MRTTGLPWQANAAVTKLLGVMFLDFQSKINGTVWAKAITPAGSRLPLYCRQMPLSQDDIAQ